MKHLLFPITLLALACGAQDLEEPVKLGTTEQAIFMPTLYGIEQGTENGIKGRKCSPPWAGGVCIVPDAKLFYWYFPTNSGCSAWWKDRIREATTSMANWGLPDWTFWEAPAQLATVAIQCGSVAGTAVGNTEFWAEECHATEFGSLCQASGTTITIDTPEMDSLPGFLCFGSTCDTRRKTFAHNVVKHESGHMLGLGHFDTASSSLMSYTYQKTDTALAPWIAELYPTPGEVSAIDCYNQNSGSSDDC